MSDGYDSDYDYDEDSDEGYDQTISDDNYSGERDSGDRPSESSSSNSGAPAVDTNYQSYFSNVPFNTGANLWDQPVGSPVDASGKVQDSRQLINYFSNPAPQGIQGMQSGMNYGKQVVADIYGSQDAKDIWSRLKDESTQGLDAASLKSIKDKYGSQGVMDQARMQKSGMKGMQALRAGENLQSKRREEAAAMDAAIKKQAFNTMRDEWGRRTLLSTNLPMAYGQLGSAAVLGQSMQKLDGQGLYNYQQYMS